MELFVSAGLITMNMCLDRSRSGLLAYIGCMLLVACSVPVVSAGEFLSNITDPTIEGEGVATRDPKDNPSMLNLGFRNIQLHPYFGASVGYDSNIYTTDTNRVDDSFFQLAPGVLVQTNAEDADRFILRWNTSLQSRLFFNESQANTVQLSSYLNATIKTSPLDLNLIGGGGRFEDPINVTFADRTPRAIGEGLFRVISKSFDKLVLEGGAHYSYIDYHTDSFASLDRSESEIPVRALYKFRETASAYVSSAWKLVEFRNPGLNSFYIVDSRVGFTAEVQERVFSFDVNVGVAVARIKNDNALNPSVRATHVVWDSVFQYQPREEFAFVLALYGTPRVNLAGGQPVRPVYGARLDTTVRLMEKKLSVTASGFYERIDNLPVDSDQVFLSGSLRARYDFRTWAFGYLAYQITGRQADGTTQDFVENKIMLGGGLTL